MAREVNIRVRGVPRSEPDLRRLARALLREAARRQRAQTEGPRTAASSEPPEESAS